MALTVASRHLHVPYHLRDLANGWFSLAEIRNNILARRGELPALAQRAYAIPKVSHLNIGQIRLHSELETYAGSASGL